MCHVLAMMDSDVMAAVVDRGGGMEQGVTVTVLKLLVPSFMKAQVQGDTSKNFRTCPWLWVN